MNVKHLLLSCLSLLFPLTLLAAATSAEAIAALTAELAKEDADYEALAQRDWASVPLTKDDAKQSRDRLWKQHSARIARQRAGEINDCRLKEGKLEMPFFMKTFGEKPRAGHSLWISLHGGGGAPARVNDSQWENQKRLYKLEEGIYLAPRAPTDNWNLWHEAHIDRLFDRLIEDLIVLEEVDPKRVYVLGYSAGGDGVYQLGPRMADRWAAAAMMAGHPNDAQPLNLRNVGFAVQAGALDSAYKRNEVAREWGEKLATLQAGDPQGYEHFVKIHEGKGHWMDGQDAAVLPWMAKLKRNPIPDVVAWQVHATRPRSYWLAVSPDDARAGGKTIVERKGQTITIKESQNLPRLTIRLDDRMADLDQPIRILYQDKQLFSSRASRTIATQLVTLSTRGDRELMYDAEVVVELEK